MSSTWDENKEWSLAYDIMPYILSVKRPILAASRIWIIFGRMAQRDIFQLMKKDEFLGLRENSALKEDTTFRFSIVPTFGW